MALDFSGRVAIVTGADDGGGPGRAHALVLAARGARGARGARVLVNDLGATAASSGA